MISDLPYGLASDDWCDECFMGIHHPGEEAHYARGTGLAYKGDPREHYSEDEGYTIVTRCHCPCEGDKDENGVGVEQDTA